MEGTTVTDPRSQTNYIATEYGMVNLMGLSTWERAEALISLAHPDFRDELIKAAEDMKIWRKSNKNKAHEIRPLWRGLFHVIGAFLIGNVGICM